MENEKSLVKAGEPRLPKFVEDAYESVEKMEKFAEILLNSKLVPNHFYEKLPDGKPDFSKGKTPAVVAVLIQGYQLQLPPLTALQHIIPVNGLLSIKGDLAKSMIFNSGKLKPGSWVEEETGSIDEGNLVVKITATRSDNGQTLSRSFSVAQAKRAGLWITEQQVNGQDGWKYKSSAWWKYPARMINYRALGFLARDMFPDVMAGVYTTEEAMDLPKDVTEVIETESGAKITIPDKEHAKKRSDKMTERVTDKIPENKFGAVNTTIQEAEVIKEKKTIPEEMAEAGEKIVNEVTKDFVPQHGSASQFNGVITKSEEEKPAIPGHLTLKEMEGMDTKVLLEIINADTNMIEAMEMIPGKNTGKKIREIIFANQEGKLAEHVASFLPPKESENQGNAGGEIPPNKAFDSQSEVKSKPGDELFPGEGGAKKSSNKYNLAIPEFDKGNQREFSTMKTLFNLLASVNPPVSNNRYTELAIKMNILKNYPDREIFCKIATVQEIDELLNQN